ncbi:uncharacterized protein LOC142777412 [Rhipicephalus microplus]|uniref:uncharacterized protein LOC142777412 n=1 Tax=Rhipicephalus microplus TaxID=6941 RepID=UPI003F6B7B48
MSPDTSTCTESRRLVDVHDSPFSEESSSLKEPSLVSTNGIPEAAKEVVACPFYQCALEEIFPDNRVTEAKRDDKVDQLLQCGFLYGKDSKQALQHKRLQRSARSPQLHGAGEQHRMAADRQQSGSKHSKTRTSMSISPLGVEDGTFALEQRGLSVSPFGRAFEARAC